MTPVCVAADPAEPGLSIYGFEVLNRVPIFTRASYVAAFGVQPPNFDATKPAKYWFDSSADPNGTYAYQTVNAQGTFSQQSIPGVEAATVNIPGVVTYPAYVVAPTTAAVVTSTSTVETLNPTDLCTYQDAVNLASAMGLPASAVISGTGWVTGPFSVNYDGDPRQLWMIVWKAGAPPLQFAGTFIAQMYANGVGAPGKWDLTGLFPVWVPGPSAPDGITSGVPTTSVPPPVRSLLPSEGLIATLFAKEIGRRDLLPPWYFPAS